LITIYTEAFPGQHSCGLIRDIRIRWALEEAELPYRVEYIDHTDPSYRVRQPFGQVPAVDYSGLPLFDSSAIILRVADGCEALLPRDEAERGRALAWGMSAITTIEYPILNLCRIDLFPAKPELEIQLRPFNEQLVTKKLDDLSTALGEQEYLEGRFTVGDLLMASALVFLRHTDLVEAHPRLGPYLRRCHSRPAYLKAMEAHMAAFLNP
jgi:glutathione S-transferase